MAAHILHLAWRYLWFYRGRSLLLVLCFTLTLALPWSVQLLARDFQRHLMRRAETTPLVLGASGSRLDLVMHALYFQTDVTSPIVLADAQRGEDLGTMIPLLVRHRAGGKPIVGTTYDYFDLRGTQLATGEPFRELGECVLGANVAREQQLAPGDTLVSDADNVLDLAGAYPLKMRVTGVLAANHSPDDDVVFVAIKTAWILAGLGHTHAFPDAASSNQTSAEESPTSVSGAGANHEHRELSLEVMPFTEITPENAHLFHFHGDLATFPLTAALFLPADDRSTALLLGRYVGQEAKLQLVRPRTVVAELLSTVLKIKRFFDLNTGVLVVVALLFTVLVMLLSLRLRDRERATMAKIGASRSVIGALYTVELLILVGFASCLAAGLAVLVGRFGPDLLLQLLA